MVNDKFGHLAGDQLIVGTATILKRTFRNSDIIPRIGGDEFAIFPVDADAKKLDAIYRRLDDTMARMNNENAGTYPLSLTVGKAYYDPAAPCSIEELLHMADMSMYEMKINRKQGGAVVSSLEPISKLNSAAKGRNPALVRQRPKTVLNAAALRLRAVFTLLLLWPDFFSLSLRIQF
jgi:diguanylate cyclase (GGDEF)-like protein